MTMHREYVDCGNRVKFTRSAIDGHVTVRTWDERYQRWTGYTVIGPAEVRDLVRFFNREDD